MLDEKDLQAIAQLMDEKLKPIKEQLSEVKEDTKITRNAVNDLLEWADDASIQVIPLFKRKAK